MIPFKEYIAEYLVNTHMNKVPKHTSGVSKRFLLEYPVNGHLKIRKSDYLYNIYKWLDSSIWGNHNTFNNIEQPTSEDLIKEISETWSWKDDEDTYTAQIAGYIWKRYGIKLIAIKSYGGVYEEAHEQLVYVDPDNEEKQIRAPYSEYRTGISIVGKNIYTPVPELQKNNYDGENTFDTSKYAELLCEYIDDTFKKYKKY